MSELLSNFTIYALYAATLGLLFVMLFIHEPRGRGGRAGALVVGALAMALPIWLTVSSLGHPDPWPQAGESRLLGWHVDEADGSIFVFVDQAKDEAPRQLRVPFSRERALQLQEAAEHFGTYREMSIVVAEGPGRFEPAFELELVKVFGDAEEESAGDGTTTQRR